MAEEIPDPIVLRTNRDWRDAVGLIEVAPDQTESPLDLTGAVMEMHIRSNAAALSAGLILSTANGRLVITDAVNGGFAFNVESDLIETSLAPGDYVCDLVVTIGDLDLVPLERSILVERGVTR